jgi:predicted metal-dependent hydrolase
MYSFIVFFLTILILFLIAQKINQNKDIIGVVSKIDKREYLVRKLPDSQQSSDKLAILNQNVIRLLQHIKNEERSGVKYLVNRYNPDKLSETALGAKYTSYSVNKGESIAMCLREPNNSFIDMNTVHFVIIHELAHVMTSEVGHTKLFWENMGYLLRKASEIGIYKYYDYGAKPIRYCGVTIDSTPFNLGLENDENDE